MKYKFGVGAVKYKLGPGARAGGRQTQIPALTQYFKHNHYQTGLQECVTKRGNNFDAVQWLLELRPFAII